ncbi:cytochrome-c oxidase, cbb3-type subunit III [Novosphingobium sp. FSY-8]|uniref:Cbb3-type cytochrome c oxidase subunit n=1 Tax=Novosphingobium ovatum TaxID=1908523 RepID=A0ABW9XG71_9SPHN|nr:cytochrome-c oxidase, cbb3-type subunit III [Novosphingobium ovatum]NBC37478.1 cytochrome-c oxidase, cbb3-type subunit III [Novosphingobium ovatum]
MANKRIDEPTGTETMGHEWDGIEELNTPLPGWWLWTFYACIIFAIAYCVVYPSWPGMKEGSHGVFGWTSRGQLAQEMAAAKADRQVTLDAIAATSLEDLPANKDLMAKAVEGGKAAFKVNCVPCHGSGAAGSKGYPNLNDNDWLWGGSLTDIHTTLLHGIRQPGDAATRMSAMPAFGRDGMLQPAAVADVVSYVRSLSGLEPASAASQRGNAVFAANCVACHGPDAKGGRMFGAPNLADKIWLYGSTREDVTETVTNAHAGVMPAWGGRLDPVTIKMLAVYVHSLGGGEKFAQPAPAGAAPAPAGAASGATNGQP